jgi:hypothetical protein
MPSRRVLAAVALAITLAALSPSVIISVSPQGRERRTPSFAIERDSRETIIRRLLLWIFDDLGEPKPS